MDVRNTQNIVLTDAITIAEGFEAQHQNLTSAEKFFDAGIKTIAPNDYEKKGQYYYYLLRVMLRKHVNFENPLLQSYYDRMTENFLQKEEEYKKDMGKEEDPRRKSLIKTQIKAFYKMLERMYQALQIQYQEKGFFEARDRAFEQLMLFKTERYRAQGRYEKVFSSMFLRVTSNYGLSLYRWTISAVAIILLFALLYLLTDKLSTVQAVTGHGNWGFDYIFLSVSAFTGFGAGDMMGLSFIHKFLLGIELLAGYFMLGLLIHLIIKRL